MTPHEPTVCNRNVRMTHYVGKSYKGLFECSCCDRKTWQHLGFLGRRDMVCNGEKFYKVDKSFTPVNLGEIE